MSNVSNIHEIEFFDQNYIHIKIGLVKKEPSVTHDPAYYTINSRDVRDGYEIMQKQNQQLNNFFQICFHFDVVYWRLISDENTKILDKTFSHLTHLLQSKWRDSFQVETWTLWKRTPRSKPDPDMSIQNSIVFLYLHLLPLYCLNFPDSK